MDYLTGDYAGGVGAFGLDAYRLELISDEFSIWRLKIFAISGLFSQDPHLSCPPTPGAQSAEVPQHPCLDGSQQGREEPVQLISHILRGYP